LIGPGPEIERLCFVSVIFEISGEETAGNKSSAPAEK